MTQHVTISSFKRNRLKVFAATFFVKGLIILFFMSCYMYNAITHSENLSWSGMVRNVAKDEPEVKTCVRQVTGSQCNFHPCVEQNGMVENAAYPAASPFGYAGHFVHRPGNMTKPLPASEYSTISVEVTFYNT